MNFLKNNLKIIKYLFFGGLNTVVTFILYVLLIRLECNYIIASTICYIIGIIEGFLFNAFFVFNQKPNIKHLYKYSLVYMVAYLINISLLFLFVYYLGLDKLLAQIVAVIIITIINFKLIKLLVFK